MHVELTHQKLRHRTVGGGAGVRVQLTRRRPADWRLGGRRVGRWDLALLLVLSAVMIVGTLGSLLISGLGTKWSGFASVAILWAAMTFSIVFAFIRARPPRLLSFRPRDILWGVAAGIALRLLQGMIGGANRQPFPSSTLLLAEGSPVWMGAEVLPRAFLGPIIEEFFFRAVILVALFQVFRQLSGRRAAAMAAVLVSAGSFVVLHAVFGPLTLADAAQLTCVGLVCSILVVSTGRVWPAVCAHVVYNASYLVLVMAGFLLM